jgi:hypothetical protein
VILQVAQPRLAFAHGRRACAPSVRAQRRDGPGTVTQRCSQRRAARLDPCAQFSSLKGLCGVAAPSRARPQL